MRPRATAHMIIISVGAGGEHDHDQPRLFRGRVTLNAERDCSEHFPRQRLAGQERQNTTNGNPKHSTFYLSVCKIGAVVPPMVIESLRAQIHGERPGGVFMHSK